LSTDFDKAIAETLKAQEAQTKSFAKRLGLKIPVPAFVTRIFTK